MWRQSPDWGFAAPCHRLFTLPNSIDQRPWDDLVHHLLQLPNNILKTIFRPHEDLEKKLCFGLPETSLPYAETNDDRAASSTMNWLLACPRSDQRRGQVNRPWTSQISQTCTQTSTVTIAMDGPTGSNKESPILSIPRHPVAASWRHLSRKAHASLVPRRSESYHLSPI
jgi:hypothetical protein